MAEIKVLSQAVADKIAAGEVAERPQSVVKELVENSIDAGATSIEVEIRKGGIEYIRICDNGCGIEENQVETAFLRHATSKLREVEDLYSIATMGFRGEALSSICAVSEVEVITKTKDAQEGVFLKLEHGKPVEKEKIACADGTTMVIKRLFENVPARMKFLKKDSTEAGYVADVLGRIALANPHIAFSYIADGKEVFATSGDNNLKNVVLKLYGIDHAKGSLALEYTEDNVTVRGLVGKPEIARGNRSRQTLLVNGRYIKNHVVSKVVAEAYRNSIMVGKFPFFVLDIIIAPELVDVNVHPAKTEIKFVNESRIYEIIYHAVSCAVNGGETEKVKEKAEIPAYTFEEKTDTQNKRWDTESPQKTEKININLAKDYLDSVIPAKEAYEIREIDEPCQIQMSVKNTEPDLALETLIPPQEEKQILMNAPIPMGQFLDTYILCEADETLYMIDQHAAHERMRFEMLKKSYYQNERLSQILLSPMIIKLDFSETNVVLGALDYYKGFGFDIEDFGSGSIIVNATPVIADETTIRDLILEIAEAVSQMGKLSIADFEEKALDMIACKYAIKANHKLNIHEMQDLIEKVWEMEEHGIKTCPHGRPIKIEFSRFEIEKMFKRKV